MTQPLTPTQADVVIPRELFDFLMGVGEIEGTSFGDLNSGRLGRFWWRALLRTAENSSAETFARHAQAARLEGARAMQEAAEIAARDCMCDQEWPPQDGDVQIDEVRAAIRDLDPLSIAEKGV